MALILKNIYTQYLKLDEFKDKRLSHLPITSVFEISLVLTGYLCMVKYGQIFMEKRKPYEIKGIIKLYNLLQVLTNFVIVSCILYILFSYRRDFDFTCQSVNFEPYGVGLQEAVLAYAYLLLKLFDLCDTLFFILSKKNSHLSFLHVYHHSVITFGAYVGLSYAAGGHNTILGLLNCIVHTFMYGYYYLSVSYPNVKNMIWLKKRLTQLQMLQFALLVIHFGRAWLFGNCNIPSILLFFGATQNVFMLFLFGDFYRRTYLTIRKRNK